MLRVLCLCCVTSISRGLNPGRRLYMDWVALNSRSTTRHIMRPLTDAGRLECLAIKRELREAVSSGAFVVDAFASAAAAKSLDAESSARGGVIGGGRIGQGVCREAELDRACFCSPIGEVTGPLRSGSGYHLVLVEERIGLAMHDAGMTRVVAEPLPSGGVRAVLAPPDGSERDDLLDPEALLNLGAAAVLTAAGGKLLAGIASSIDVDQIASSMA